MLKDQLKKEVETANAQIEELELLTHVVSPESTLSDIISFENVSEDEANQRQLKKVYMKKRKLLFFTEQLKNNISLSCDTCGKEIELERLLIMPRARLCAACANS
jgi:RNA polymerase-binding transcription factor DksA